MEEFEIKAIHARLSDLARATERGVISHSFFLTPPELRVASEWVRHMGLSTRSFFYGGYKNAERKCVFFLPEFYEALINDPSDEDSVLSIIGSEINDVLKPLLIKGSGFRVFSHRDYLGAVLNLGIERSSVGDLCPADDFSCVFFALSPVADLILSDLSKVGSDKVKTSVMKDTSGFSYERKTKQTNDTVASDRFDCVVASLISESREKAKEKILAGICELRDGVCMRTDQRVENGDTISIRGHGKFIINDISEETKKGRLKLNAAKFI